MPVQKAKDPSHHRKGGVDENGNGGDCPPEVTADRNDIFCRGDIQKSGRRRGLESVCSCRRENFLHVIRYFPEIIRGNLPEFDPHPGREGTFHARVLTPDDFASGSDRFSRIRQFEFEVELGSHRRGIGGFDENSPLGDVYRRVGGEDVGGFIRDLNLEPGPGMLALLDHGVFRSGIHGSYCNISPLGFQSVELVSKDPEKDRCDRFGPEDPGAQREGGKPLLFRLINLCVTEPPLGTDKDQYGVGSHKTVFPEVIPEVDFPGGFHQYHPAGEAGSDEDIVQGFNRTHPGDKGTAGLLGGGDCDPVPARYFFPDLVCPGTGNRPFAGEGDDLFHSEFGGFPDDLVHFSPLGEGLADGDPRPGLDGNFTLGFDTNENFIRLDHVDGPEIFLSLLADENEPVARSFAEGAGDMECLRSGNMDRPSVGDFLTWIDEEAVNGHSFIVRGNRKKEQVRRKSTVIRMRGGVNDLDVEI